MLSGKLRASAATLAALSAIQLSACSDKLPEIRYGSTDFTIENPEVLPLLREEYNELVRFYDFTVKSFVGPYLYYSVYDDGSIALSAAHYYIFCDDGRNYWIKLSSGRYYENDDGYIDNQNIDEKVIANSSSSPVGRNFFDFYYDDYVGIGNSYYTFIVRKDDIVQFEEDLKLPNPPDGALELVEDIANRYGDELFELAPEAVEVPLELLEDVSE